MYQAFKNGRLFYLKRMIIKNIEQKIKLATIVSVLALIAAVIIVIFTLLISSKQLHESRKSIYVLANGVPVSAEHRYSDDTRDIEYKSHIEKFHNLFFTITPDNEFIEKNIAKAMYLIDESGIQQYNTLKEKGFYSQIMSASAVLTLIPDSVVVDYKNRYFRYYGKQKIDRKSSTSTRSLITEGYLKDIPRSENNPHGLLILNWRTIENKDIRTTTKQIF